MHRRRGASPVSYVLLAALAMGAVGCDSSATRVADNNFFVGTWKVESVRDAAGDRTDELSEAVYNFYFQFDPDNTFELGVEYSDPLVGQSLLAGTYEVTPQGQLVLTVGNTARVFATLRMGGDAVELIASAPAVQSLVGQPHFVGAALAGEVTLTLSRAEEGPVTLDPAYFDGNWQVTAIRDHLGDRTAEVFERVYDFRMSFMDDAQFLLVVEYTDSKVGVGIVDGTYEVATSREIVLDDGTHRRRFGVTTRGADRVELRAPSPTVQSMVGSPDYVGRLQGTVVLTLERGEARPPVDPAFFIGNWRMNSIRDDLGDRTEEINLNIDAFRLALEAGDAFRLAVVYTEDNNWPNNHVDGEYVVLPSRRLILNDGTFERGFGFSLHGENGFELRAPSPTVQSLIGGPQIVGALQGQVILTMVRDDVGVPVLDTEFLAGEWEVIRVRDAAGDRTSEIAQNIASQVLRFNGGFEWYVSYVAENQWDDNILTGTFSLEPGRILRLIEGANTRDLALTIRRTDIIEFRAPAGSVQSIIGLPQFVGALHGTVTLTLERQSSRFTRR
ncbi:hypothetical protein BH23BAC4_BH23BAC4_14240 [soil metagenome]